MSVNSSFHFLTRVFQICLPAHVFTSVSRLPIYFFVRSAIIIVSFCGHRLLFKKDWRKIDRLISKECNFLEKQRLFGVHAGVIDFLSGPVGPTKTKGLGGFGVFEVGRCFLFFRSFVLRDFVAVFKINAG